MNTQSTPVHMRLWHRDFWLMSFASLLLSMSVYVLLPVMPRWLMEVENFSPEETGLSMGVFALGLYLFGPHCSWLVERYRRNIVCIRAMLVLAADLALLWYIDSLRSEFVGFWVIMSQRFVLGAAFGLAQMVLSSTLVIDTCESFWRTEANHSVTWFSRLALALGPMAGLTACCWGGFGGALCTAMALSATAALLVYVVGFPFRSPGESVRVASLDRFFLPQGGVLYAHLLLVSASVGMLLSLPLVIRFYALVAAGFLLALLAQRFVFRDAELKSEVVSGLFLIIAAQLVLLAYPDSPASPVLLGLGTGVVAARFLLFFIKLCRHCQRGTSQSTYFLGWETGIALGLGAGYGLFYQRPEALICTALALSCVALLVYHLFTHRWFMSHKNR